MPASETPAQHEEVLTLPEAAAYLRVSEEALRKLAADHAIPAQHIDQEWRFLKRALVDWLRYGPRYYREFYGFPPPWAYEYPPVEELMQVLEKRLLGKMALLEQTVGRRGSKQALRKHLGMFRDEGDIEEVLADLQARRKAGNAEGDE
jgi:excisionase family DNA binding protein